VSHVINIAEVDRDGAIQEAAYNLDGNTRAELLRRGLVGGGAIFGGAALMGLPALASAAGGVSAKTVGILNYALTLEYLEAAFYAEGVSKGKLSGSLGSLAKTIAQHEQAHVDFLKKALGSAAVKKPKFNFKGTTSDPTMFGATAYVLENAGVAAYSGQATNIKEAAVVKAAVSILTVEARHAGWIGAVIGKSPAPAGFDTPQTKAQILAAVRSTGFIVG
jgi:ferritin-like protein